MGTSLSPADLEAIEAKISEVEKTTAGEIVVHVAARSDDYPAVRLAWAGVLATVAAEVLSYEFAAVFQPWTLELAVGIALLLWLVLGWSAILRWLIPTAQKQACVHRRALAAFVENRVHRTRDASGVLILVSMLERRVELLADEGIHARVGVEGWTAHVDRIIDGIRSGRPAAGIVDTIGRIGEELTAGIPPRPDDENELSNQVIVTSR